MDFNYEVKTSKTFSSAVEDLKKSLSDYNFGVLWELNLKEKMEEKRLDFEHNFKVLEVCNTKQAKEILDLHIEAGYFLPCKMVVYEKGNSVFMGMMRPTSTIGMLEQEDLRGIAQQVETVLKKVLDEAI